jgi:hypothetical protein
MLQPSNTCFWIEQHTNKWLIKLHITVNRHSNQQFQLQAAHAPAHPLCHHSLRWCASAANMPMGKTSALSVLFCVCVLYVHSMQVARGHIRISVGGNMCKCEWAWL